MRGGAGSVSKRFLNGFQLLYRLVQIKIKCRCDAELRKCMFHCCLDKSIYDLLIFKLDLLFCRVYVHIHLRGIEINEKYIEWKTVRGDYILICTHDGMIQIGTADE